MRIREENLQKEVAQWPGISTLLDKLSEISIGTEVFSRAVFDTLLEAKVLVERWKREYNHVRPHSSLGQVKGHVWGNK